MKDAFVHLVEDDRAVRTALARVLHCAGYDVRSYASAVEFLVAARAERPGCVVLDVGLPGMSGVELQAAMAKDGNGPPIVFVTGRGDVEASVRAMKAGAVDFLTKPVKRDALLAAVGAAVDRDAQQRARQANLDALQARFARLTPRERQVFAAIVRGKLNKQIADALGTSVRTVKAHRAQVMSKLEAASFAELMNMAARLDELTDNEASS